MIFFFPLLRWISFSSLLTNSCCSSVSLFSILCNLSEKLQKKMHYFCRTSVRKLKNKSKNNKKKNYVNFDLSFFFFQTGIPSVRTRGRNDPALQTAALGWTTIQNQRDSFTGEQVSNEST